MIQADRDRLLERLMEGNGKLKGSARRALEECCAEDVEAIEPIIDKIIDRECQAAVTRVFAGQALTRMINSRQRRALPRFPRSTAVPPKVARRKDGAQ